MEGNARSGCAPRKVVRCYWRPNLKHSRITVNILPSLIIQLLENFRTLVWAEVFKTLALLINGLPAGAGRVLAGRRLANRLPARTRPAPVLFFLHFPSTTVSLRFKPVLHAVC